jgi:hypothetical protein
MRLILAALTAALVLVVAVVACGSDNSDGGSARAAAGPGDPPSVKAVFYYPWFSSDPTKAAEGWRSRYTPTLGKYDSSDPAVIQQHVRWMDYAGMDAAISSWWGPNTREDQRTRLLLDNTQSIGSDLKWALYYEDEGSANPTTATIRADLDHVKAQGYTTHPNYLQRNGKPVLFVYAGTDTCEMADRWEPIQDFYVVLKVLSGYKTCPNQPDSWHQYGPATARSQHMPFSNNVSPGFWRHDEASPRLVRDPARFRSDLEAMKVAAPEWMLVTSFNEFGEGTVVEPTLEFGTTYLDAMKAVFGGAVPEPTPTPTPTPTPSPTPTATPTPTPTPAPATTKTVVAVGDMACRRGVAMTTSGCRHKPVSDLALAQNPDAFLGLGDTQYECGELVNYQQSYHPSYGRMKGITIPAIGNHEYQNTTSTCDPGTPPGGEGHFRYFGWEISSPRNPGCVASPACTGYWSEQVGAWHVVVLNSNCGKVGGCGVGSTQEKWLRADLAADTSQCTVGIWHHPRFSSGQHGDHTSMTALWKALQDDRADLVLQGHDHNYERFAAKTSDGTVTSAGIPSFVVGGGGRNRYSMEANPRHPGSVSVDDDSFGVLRLSLRPDGFDWRYLVESGPAFVDSGSAQCR